MKNETDSLYLHSTFIWSEFPIAKIVVEFSAKGIMIHTRSFWHCIHKDMIIFTIEKYMEGKSNGLTLNGIVKWNKYLKKKTSIYNPFTNLLLSHTVCSYKVRSSLNRFRRRMDILQDVWMHYVLISLRNKGQIYQAWYVQNIVHFSKYEIFLNMRWVLKILVSSP